MNIFKVNNMFYTKWFLKIVFVLLAFMPCSVKNSLFLNHDFQAAKALNVAKVPNSTTANCFSASVNDLKSEINKQTQKHIFSSENRFSSVKNISFFDNKLSYAYSSNAPPFYILYQRLKVYDLV